FASLNRAWSPASVWGLALVTTFLFFVSIVLHELAHAIVARLSGIPVRGITLFALGGIAQIEKDAATPDKKFWMAIAGPGGRVLRSAVWAITHSADRGTRIAARVSQ